MLFTRPRSAAVLGQGWIFCSVLLISISCGDPSPVASRVDLQSATHPVQLADPDSHQRSGLEVRRVDDVPFEQRLDTPSAQDPFERIFKHLFSSQSAPAREPGKPLHSEALVLGFPTELLGQNYVFGGVVTHVSAANSETLGRLKLSDLPPLHVRPQIIKDSKQGYRFALVGCENKCGEGSEEKVLHSMPILGYDLSTGRVFVDLSVLGSELNLVQRMDPAGLIFGSTTESAEVTAFEFSLSTLVFDIRVRTRPTLSLGPLPKLKTEFNLRWYLKLASSFTPGFEPRPATPGVGFFMTKRSSQPKVTRFAALGSAPEAPRTIHYYIKGVPPEYRAAFSDAFDEWNQNLQPILKRKVLTYEFLENSDPRFTKIITGDIRYNVVEWDTTNRAPYGGLGPSTANQFTGEIFNATTLIQGPALVAAYRAWFDGKIHRKPPSEDPKVPGNGMWELSVGGHGFRIPAQSAPYQDPEHTEQFEDLPPGVTFQEYMHGYFRAMVAHELGHNLGLRHNFRGSLGFTALRVGAVSNSIMEYLGRRHRHLNQVGPYDRMAIAYGYTGLSPDVTDAYCTDEQVARVGNASLSAECSKEDATQDPFHDFEDQLEKITHAVVGTDHAEGPRWTPIDLSDELDRVVTGMLFYAQSANDNAGQWTQFFTDPSRPRGTDEIRRFVMESIRHRICAEELETTAAGRTTEGGRKQARENLHELRERTANIAHRFGTQLAPASLTCTKLPENVFAR